MARKRRNILWDSELQEQAVWYASLAGVVMVFLTPTLFPCSCNQKKSVDISNHPVLSEATRAAMQKLSQEIKCCPNGNTISHRVGWTMNCPDDCYIKFYPGSGELMLFVNFGGAETIQKWKNVSDTEVHAVAAAGGRPKDLEKHGAIRLEGPEFSSGP